MNARRISVAARRGRVFSVASLIVAVGAAGGKASHPAPSGRAAALGVRTHSCIPSWRAVATARMPREIAAVAARSRSDVWAVGPRAFADVSQSLVIVHWDGRRLTVNYPFKFRAGSADLSSIAAISTNDVWAVGSHNGTPLVVHWDGRRWQLVRTPRLKTAAALAGVVALSPRNIWAVGNRGDDPALTRPLVMQWNGRRWNITDIRATGELNAVDAAGANDMWAMGDDAGAGGGINDVDALAMHWNGQRWETVPTPIPDDSDLGEDAADEFDDVDAVTATEAWAVHSGELSSDIQRWNGRAWSIAVRFRRKLLRALVADPRRSVWAVGGSTHPLVVHRAGTGLTDVTPHRLRRLRAGLADIAAISPHEIWAAGSRLLARYSCSTG